MRQVFEIYEIEYLFQYKILSFIPVATEVEANLWVSKPVPAAAKFRAKNMNWQSNIYVIILYDCANLYYYMLLVKLELSAVSLISFASLVLIVAWDFNTLSGEERGVGIFAA